MKKKKKGKYLKVFSIKKKPEMEGHNNDSMPEQHLPDEGFIKRVAHKLEIAASSPDRSNLHIIARGDHWVIKREGAQKVYRICETQTQAINSAKEMIERGIAAHIIIHEDDGTVAQRI